jgi:hypothetical protein
MQSVPANAPPGIYSFNAYVGLSPLMIWGQDSFTFEKLEAGGEASITGWENWGEGFEESRKGLTTDLPSRFALLGNYPNPFNPVTTIRYGLPEASLVTLEIFDISGRSQGSPLHAWREAGLHEVTWDASHLSSGIYVYRLEAGEFVGMGKMVLMK